MANVSVTWLGHAAFRIDSARGKRIYVDPWLGNPKCPESERDPERMDVLALTHGHDDHAGDAPELMQRFSPTLVAAVELQNWIERQGVDVGDVPGVNKGGSREVDGILFTMTDARHSSSCPDGTYAGEAAGLVMEFENGFKLYHAGDTCVFGDMRLVGELYEPDVAILPIGGHFTMDPREAARALELLGVRRCIPCHYGTFPLLRGTPDELRREARDAEVLALAPGETIEL